MIIKNLILAVSMLAISATASAVTVTTLSTTGTLATDDSMALTFFTVSETSAFTAQTFSYGGGIQADGNVVAAGGFDTILSLFTGAGVLVAQNDDGGGLTDPATDSAYDSLIDGILLGAGNYFLGISQFSFSPTDLFSGGTSGVTNFDGRTSAYAHDITLSTVPVPAAGILFASALFGAGFLGRRKKKAKKSNMIGAFARTA